MSITLRELAWKSWLAGGNAVAIDAEGLATLRAEAGTGALIEDEAGLRFADVAMLIQEAAAFVVEHEGSILASSGDACFHRLSELWFQDKVDGVSLPGTVLVRLHNERRLDAYTFAREAVIAGVKSYEVTRTLEEAVGSFTHASALSILGFFGGDYGEQRHFSAATLLEPLAAWLSPHIEVAQEIEQLHEATPKEQNWGIYTCALHAIVNRDFAGTWAQIIRRAESSERSISGPALHVMGTVDYKDPVKAAASADTLRICTQIVRTPGHPLLGQVVSVLGRMIGTHESQAVLLLDEAGQTTDMAALSAITHILLREARDRWREPWFWTLALHLTRVPPDQKDILSMVDVMVSDWLKSEERVPRGVEFLYLWMAQQSRQALGLAGPEVLFDSAVVELARKPALLGRLITTWLLEEDRRYPHAVQKMISKLTVAGMHDFPLAAELLDLLSEEELRFLVRRIIGYLLTEDVLLTVVFSMVRTRNAKTRTFGFVSTVMRDYVGRDYPDTTLRFLKKVQASEKECEEVRALCASVAGDIEAILGEIEALPNLREFHPPADKVNRFRKERHRQMNDAIEDASRTSIWRQIATQIPLKAGIRTFHSREGQYSSPMELKPMSHSIAIPLSAVSDPMGVERERLQFRSGRKPGT